ncbi:MAG: flagellar biosynthetic protein FliR [Thalassovita sp.]
MTALSEALGLSQLWLWHGFLILLRVGAAMSLAPGFGEQSLPVRIKLAASVMVTVVLAPLIPVFDQSLWAFSALLKFTASEVAIGLLIGIGLRLFVLALQTAGSIAAQSTSLSQILGASAEPMPAMGHVLVIGGLALAMATGFHVQVLGYLAGSYDLFPAGKMPLSSVVADWGTSQISLSFKLAFQLAGPFVLVSLLYNLALGAINRGMPQLMVAFVGAPAITAGGLALLAILAPQMLHLWVIALQAFASDPGGALR